MQETPSERVKMTAIIRMGCLLGFLWSGCTNDIPFSDTAEVRTTFRLSSASSLDGKISIHEAYLKLDHIEARGMLAGQSLAMISNDIPGEDPPFKLTGSDSSHTSFGMPATAYDQIIYDLYLFQDTYELIFDADPKPDAPLPPPPPVNNNGNGGEPNGPPPAGDDNPGSENGDGDTDGDADEQDDDDEENVSDNDNDHDGDEGDKDDGGKKDKKNKEKKKKNKDNKGKKNNDDGGRLTSRSNATIVDLDHFFQNAKPSLVAFGTYNNNSKPLAIIFAVTGKDKLTARSTENENILLTNKSFAEAIFHPEQWFASITTADIETAQRQTYQGQEVLFIHKDVNSGLYARLLSQLESSTRLTFRTPPNP